MACVSSCVIHRVAASKPLDAVALGDTVDAGTPITVIAVHPEDAYKPIEKQLRGRACIVSDLLTRQRTSSGTYYSGSVDCDADGYYFYKVQVARRVGTGDATKRAVMPIAADDTRWPTSVPAVDGRWRETVDRIDAPAIVQIVAIHADDAYKSVEASHVGRVCRVTNSLQNNGDGYFVGAVICQGGEDFNYYKARVRILRRG